MRTAPSLTLFLGLATFLGMALFLGMATGCFSTSSPPAGDPYYDLYSDDPVIRQNAIRIAAQQRDVQSIPHMIHNLRSSEQWVRFMSITGLLRILNSSDSRGFDFLGPASDREAAVKRWEQWYEAEGKQLTQAPPVPPPDPTGW